jgi:hypothetical protein
MNPFGLFYFWAYTKQFIKFLCTIVYKFVKLSYEIIVYKDTIFTCKNLRIDIITYLFT